MTGLARIGQFIFIRHGEKISNNVPGLASQGQFRANNLYRVFGPGNTPPGKYNTPDIIYAMEKGKHEESSTRPFDTVAPLARDYLGMDPQPGERTGHHGNSVFDNRFRKKKIDDLLKDVQKHADSSYVGKTVMVCWEHQHIPDIVQAFGLNPLNRPLYWGANPASNGDEETNFNAIWVFNPGKDKSDPDYFRVYEEFNITPNLVNANGDAVGQENEPFRVEPPAAGYGTPVWPPNS